MSNLLCIVSILYSATLQSKHPYKRTEIKLRVNERIYYFSRWLKVANFFVLAKTLSFWLAFLHLLFQMRLKIWLNINRYPKNLFVGNIFSCSIVQGKTFFKNWRNIKQYISISGKFPLEHFRVYMNRINPDFNCLWNKELYF